MRLLLILTFLTSIAFGQEPEKVSAIFGCVPVKGDFLYAKDTEVTNFQYLEFLVDQRKIEGEEYYESMLPDTTLWRNKFAFNEPYVEYYFRHPAYRDYPVVNISRHQANEFCDWLEMRLNMHFDSAHKTEIAKIDVRLPTNSEWALAARGGDQEAIFPWKGKSMRHTEKKWEGDMMANFVRGRGDYMGVAGHLNDHADVTAPVYSYWPNGYGLYNMAGNVAEMIHETGRTKGGSWRSRAPYLEIDGEDPHQGFTAGSPEIGFRYFVEVVETREVKKVKPIKFSAKMVEDLLVEIGSDSVYASKYEVTNQLYGIFVDENFGQGYEPKSENWIGSMPYARRYVSDYYDRSTYDQHPVVNITTEQASAFCAWIEERYNGLKKRKYEELTFRLPTEKEWEYTASGGLSYNPYPWGGPYARNAKGSWLCNFNPVQERWVVDLNDSTYLRDGISLEQIRSCAGQDGVLVTAPVDSYHPNDFGVYNASGNVAEMVSDSPVVKGGSWASLVHFIHLKNKEAYSGASPYVGFRFMAFKK